MDRCYEIYKTEHGTDNACSAVFLLGSFAHDEALPWIREFLEDASVGIRLNGLRVLQRVVFGPLGDKDSNTVRELFDKAESDPDPEMRERAQRLAAWWRNRS
jgi:HEAT repeat protein